MYNSALRFLGQMSTLRLLSSLSSLLCLPPATSPSLSPPLSPPIVTRLYHSFPPLLSSFRVSFTVPSPPHPSSTPLLAPSASSYPPLLLPSHLSCRGPGGTSSLPMLGPQSNSPASAKDSRLPSSEFTSTLHSPTRPPLLLTVCCTSWHLMYTLTVCRI